MQSDLSSADQFQRVEQILGSEGLGRLRESFAVIVGLGAVGGFAAEALARSGIGRLRLVDYDWIRPSNINRQILATWETIGRKKCDLARERIRSISPDCRLETLDLFAHVETLNEILEGEPDIVIDAIDSLNPKTELIAALIRRKQAAISSMGAALRTDPTKIRIGPLSEITHCPLAATVRKRLRRRGLEPDIPCVYSNEETRLLYRQAIRSPECSGEIPEFSRGRERSSLGSLPTITGIFGLTLAHWVLMRLGRNGS